MKTSLSIRIGLRYFRSARRDGFLSLVSWISLLGMFLGVLSLIVVMSVMNGFEAELRSRVLSVIPHGVVTGADNRLSDWRRWGLEIETVDGVKAAAPSVGGKASLLSGELGKVIQLNAIDRLSETRITRLDQQIVSGRYLSGKQGQYEIILGDILARHLRVVAGEYITVLLPRVTVTPLGIFPREKQFRVVGLFSAGAQLDADTAFINLGDGQRFYQLGDDVHGLRIELDDLFLADKIMPQLSMILPEGARSVGWAESQGSLFAAVKMEKTMVRLLLMFIVLIAAFNIISILTMAVSEKRGAIAVLRSMGASPAGITWVFISYGMVTGLIGLVLGLATGIPLAVNFGQVVLFLEGLFGMHVFDPNVYFISAIPSELHWQDVFWVAILALILNLLATLYPARKAAQIAPAEVLRYE